MFFKTEYSQISLLFYLLTPNDRAVSYEPGKHCYAAMINDRYLLNACTHGDVVNAVFWAMKKSLIKKESTCYVTSLSFFDNLSTS